MRLCEDVSEVDVGAAGQLSFVETMSVLDRPPRQIGHEKTIVFFNDSEMFHWQRPNDELCDVRTGVICAPSNFHYDPRLGDLPDSVIRITALAHFDRWNGLSQQQYQLEKLRWFDRVAESAVRFVPDYRRHVIDTDMFTPKTIRRFTWHDQGAVYGAPDKHLDGRTHLPNVFVCGTDQGFVGIVGAIMSGIGMANRWLLRDAPNGAPAGDVS
jgi:phytoene dehydrogenase-like protein